MVDGTVCDNYAPYLDFCIYWRANENIQGGYSDVYVKMYLKNWGLVHYSNTDGFINIDGNKLTFSTHVDAPSYQNDAIIQERNFQVKHDDNGCKRCRIECEYIWNGYYNSVKIYKFYKDLWVDFTCIDRSPPSVQLTVTNIQQNSFTVQGQAHNGNCFNWQYTINDGSSWINFPNNYGESTSTDITGLTENTEYKVQVWCQREYNHVGGYSDKQAHRTQKEQNPPTIYFSVINIQPYSFTIEANSDV